MNHTGQSITSILGMHRSGTSCLTGCLQEKGLHLGVVNDCAPHNHKGNKEFQPVVRINRELLEFNDASWDDPPRELEWDDELRDMRDKVLRKIRFQNIQGFKDPRMLLTLPFWMEAVPDFKFVGTFRHPSAVARSLERRANLPPATPSTELWVHYNQLLLEAVDRYKFPIICFDWDPETYLDAIENIADYLGLPKSSRSVSSGFFERKLRTAQNARLLKTSPQAETLYDTLCGRADAYHAVNNLFNPAPQTRPARPVMGRRPRQAALS